ncbi:phosphoribosylglycinamide formyltransferase [Umboniibacter marinipuniceus]|uniref:Phosphoribosylglycinamide formyltransferase n=1 Tax=Umboniibacter marinipuniceus TaxID=569599 RepID=A0A3M0AFW2_9GAMM|nr:phosphoribosylglycinamide formyltransferase [Umboniibacter marinipuniceus]RMA81385.1 formyltetrahydrofolate-dependent phosphoribosylglycinamide formyltransferase [Umboniibacter marinipuniceus]
MKRIIVLASGSGTNLQAIIDADQRNAFAGNVVGVISNVPTARCLTRAEEHGIKSVAIDHTQFGSREEFEAQLSEAVDAFAPDLIILAGFMRILTPVFVDKYLGKLINIHPSLLPKYPGLNTHQRAIDAGDEFAGATVHYVTAELDGGPPIIQGKTPIDPDMTAKSLAERILFDVEHHIFPVAVSWFCDNRLRYENGRALLDNKVIDNSGILWKTSEQVSQS